MAYKNLLNQACADKAELFCRVRDFICKRNATYDYSVTGIGWTLHDSFYAVDEGNPAFNDWFVIYSPGEGGKDDIYIKFIYVSNYINVHFYQSWNNTLHTPSNPYLSINWNMPNTGTKTLWIYGDLDEITCVHKLTTSNYPAFSFGKLDKGWDDQSKTIATCASALSAGSDVSITVDAVPPNWAVGKEIYIRTTHNNNTSTVKIEKTTIKTVVGNTITADLVNSYPISSKLSDFVGYFITGHNGWAQNSKVLIGENGNGSQLGYWVSLSIPESYFDPGDYEERWYLLRLFLSGTGAGLAGKANHVRKIPSINAPLAVEDIIGEEDGTQWRVFAFGNTANSYAIREV